MGTRDDMCGIDVGRMAELGGFAEEITIIGCAYKERGEVLYRVTDDPQEAYIFYENAARQGLLPTLPQIYVRREIVPAGQRERMTDEAKRTCARQMQGAFNTDFWGLFDTLAASDASNGAFRLLEQQRQMLEGRYAREPLDLFCVFLNEALLRHRLTPQVYAQFANWADENYEKMADDWIVKEQHERTFYGFAFYRNLGRLNMRVDTAPFNLLQKQQSLRQQGFAVTPIFRRTLQYKENAALPKVRREFQEWLENIVRSLALPFEDAIRATTMSCAPFSVGDLAELSETACETLEYYCALWGMQRA